MARKEKTQAQKERDAKQLRRLQTLMDVVFGVLLIRVFSLLPHLTNPESGRIDPLVIFTEKRRPTMKSGNTIFSIFFNLC